MEQHVDWKEVLSKARAQLSGFDRLGFRIGDKRVRGEFTGNPSLIVYVQSKKRPEVPVERFVPTQFERVATDVVEPFGPDRPGRYLDYIRDQDRSHDLSALDFGKIHRLASPEPGRVPAVSAMDVVGDVAVLEDREGRLIARVNGEDVLDLVAAYRAFQNAMGDDFHWVTFFADEATGVPTFDTSFQLGIYNDVEGIGLPPADYRGEFGSRTLQSVHFIHSRHMNRYVMLQEVGHQWCAFTRFRDRPDGPLRTDLLIQRGGGAFSHWDILFDDDRSPVDYDEVDWQDNADGTFTPQALAEEQRSFCDLDLYLMGLIPHSRVGSFYYLSNIRSLGGDRYQADRHPLAVRNVIWAEGERRPEAAASQTAFRHAFVLVTRDKTRAASLAHAIDRFRRAFMEDFADATRGLARANTGLRPRDGRPEELTLSLRGEVLIPDRLPERTPVAIQRRMLVGDTRAIQNIEVAVEIRHPYVDDLEIALTGPDGTSATLRKFQADGREVEDLSTTYTPANTDGLRPFLGKPARGEWTFSIADLWEEDEGHLLSWSLKFFFRAGET